MSPSFPRLKDALPRTQRTQWINGCFQTSFIPSIASSETQRTVQINGDNNTINFVVQELCDNVYSSAQIT